MSECPPLEKLEAFLADPSSGGGLKSHVDSCAQCRQASEEIRGENALLGELQDAILDASLDPLQSPPSDPPEGYEILSEIHRGGQGLVFKAIQRSTKRIVALKVLLQGAFATTRQRRRFEREIDLVASLEHPNIVRLYDSGATSDGRHYFAMQYIEGRPLDQYVADARKDAALTLPDALRLVIKICSAVNFAHQRGIIHRDLKPSNIIIDAQGEPHVLDFGLAKATDDDLRAVGPTVTMSGEFMGTLAYASPEQTKGDPSLIDIRSDVYALGVILYEMLTGQYPYPVDGAMGDALRAIAEMEPVPPGTWQRRLSRAGDDGGAKIFRVDRELETIVLKALEKDPARRYQSVGELGDDLDRYLAHQPILARPPSTTYQLRKLVARHKAPFAFVAVLFVLITGFGIWMTVLYGDAERQRRTAEANLTRAIEAEKTATDEAERARTKAATATRVKDFLTELFAAASPQQAQGKTVTARDLVDQGAEKIREELKAEPVVQGELMYAIGTVYLQLGIAEEAIAILRDSLEIQRMALGEGHRDTIDTWDRLAESLFHSGQYEKAVEEYRQALKVAREALGEEDAVTATVMANYAMALRYQTGSEGEAEREDLLRKAFKVFRRVSGKDDAETIATAALLASEIGHQGRLAEAEALCIWVLEANRRTLGDDHPSTLVAASNLASSFFHQGKFKKVEPLWREAHQRFRRILGPEHKNTIISATNVTVVLWQMDRGDEAEALARETIAEARTLGVDKQLPALQLMKFLSHVLCDRGQQEEAAELIQETLDILRSEWSSERANTVNALTVRAYILWKRGRLQEAEAHMRESLAAVRELYGDSRKGTLWSMLCLAAVLTDLNRLEEAEGMFEKIFEHVPVAFVEGHPHIPFYATHHARCLTKLGRFDEAEAKLIAAHAELTESLGDNHRHTLAARDALNELNAARAHPADNTTASIESGK